MTTALEKVGSRGKVEFCGRHALKGCRRCSECHECLADEGLLTRGSDCGYGEPVAFEQALDEVLGL